VIDIDYLAILVVKRARINGNGLFESRVVHVDVMTHVCLIKANLASLRTVRVGFPLKVSQRHG
jgi:hypothetical protein